MQKRPLPDDWKTSDLLLLIGGNRLPNYVAAKLLLQKGGTAHLLHSARTVSTALTLQTVLENKGLQAKIVTNQLNIIYAKMEAVFGLQPDKGVKRGFLRRYMASYLVGKCGR